MPASRLCADSAAAGHRLWPAAAVYRLKCQGLSGQGVSVWRQVVRQRIGELHRRSQWPFTVSASNRLRSRDYCPSRFTNRESCTLRLRSLRARQHRPEAPPSRRCTLAECEDEALAIRWCGPWLSCPLSWGSRASVPRPVLDEPREHEEDLAARAHTLRGDVRPSAFLPPVRQLLEQSLQDRSPF